MKPYSGKERIYQEPYEPELRNLKFLFGIYAFFIISSIVMPQYFGIHLGYDITCVRFVNMLFIIYMCANPKILTHFIQTTLRCEIFYPLCLYLAVAGYTMVLRVNINAFFLVFFEIFSLFMMVYGIRYVVGYKRTIKWIIGCAYFLCGYGLVEFACGKSLFVQFLKTMPADVVSTYRSGYYRIMGPCGHALGYGLVLLLFIAIACIDLDKNTIYVFKHPILMALIFINVFLTGSRSTLGIAVLELILLIIFSTREDTAKSLYYLGMAIVCFIAFLLLFYSTGVGQYLMGQITSVMDEFLDTDYAAKFGVQTERLKNSGEYRKALPKIFKLDWLNPLVGRGKSFGGAEIDGIYIHSIDNYYVLQYIKYAYPGLVAYCLFMLVLLVDLIRRIMQKVSEVSAVTKAVFIGVVVYFVNLWWVDALQTLKYVYIVIAIFYAARFEEQDRKAKSSEVT
ncbi:MAG: hypothetical protein E7268_03445 [Lachnospiraceae bacterium]|nr:hypothetical protein [Lachnospiraceae bacterium]